ncbi:MAG: peroxide stress protein YaaA [Pseudomonadota bacterium]
MLILLSPAKNLNFDPAPLEISPTKPSLARETAVLAEHTRGLTRANIKKLMGLSDQLTDLNFERFQAFKTKGRITGAISAAFAFNGDVYQGLDARSLDEESLDFAQKHVRILSGLYGVLRPLDAIQPYRLEMGTKLANSRGRDLYDFWGDLISSELNKALRGHADKTIVNLASNEYFSAVDQDALGRDVITPAFKEEKDGKLKSLMFYAKRARGMMARWAIDNRAETVDDLKAFNLEGYSFRPDGSSPTHWLFTRPQPTPKNQRAA